MKEGICSEIACVVNSRLHSKPVIRVKWEPNFPRVHTALNKRQSFQSCTIAFTCQTTLLHGILYHLTFSSHTFSREREFVKPPLAPVRHSGEPEAPCPNVTAIPLASCVLTEHPRQPYLHYCYCSGHSFPAQTQLKSGCIVERQMHSQAWMETSLSHQLHICIVQS